MTDPSPLEWFTYAIGIIKGEYPENQWPDYNVPQMEASCKQLQNNLSGLSKSVREMTDAHKRMDDTYRKLLTLCIQYLQPRHPSDCQMRYDYRKRELVRALKDLCSNR